MSASIAKRLPGFFLPILFALLLGTACSGAGDQQQEQAGGGNSADKAAVAGNFKKFDVDNNNELNRQEVDRGVFESFDTNNNGTIEEKEFRASASNWFGHSNISFNNLDTNANNKLDQKELNKAVSQADLFKNWNGDKNKAVAANEFKKGISQVRQAAKQR